MMLLLRMLKAGEDLTIERGFSHENKIFVILKLELIDVCFVVFSSTYCVVFSLTQPLPPPFFLRPL